MLQTFSSEKIQRKTYIPQPLEHQERRLSLPAALRGWSEGGFGSGTASPAMIKLTYQIQTCGGNTELKKHVLPRLLSPFTLSRPPLV